MPKTTHKALEIPRETFMDVSTEELIKQAGLRCDEGMEDLWRQYPIEANNPSKNILALRVEIEKNDNPHFAPMDIFKVVPRGRLAYARLRSSLIAYIASPILREIKSLYVFDDPHVQNDWHRRYFCISHSKWSETPRLYCWRNNGMVSVSSDFAVFMHPHA